MKEWLIEITEFSVLVINAMALIIILIGTVGAFAGAVRALVLQQLPAARRNLWLRYANWLVAGLTFQLAADIVESSIAMSWEAVGRLAAVAVIRTFLNYFLERDVAEAREQPEASSRPVRE